MDERTARDEVEQRERDREDMELAFMACVISSGTTMTPEEAIGRAAAIVQAVRNRPR